MKKTTVNKTKTVPASVLKAAPKKTSSPRAAVEEKSTSELKPRSSEAVRLTTPTSPAVTSDMIARRAYTIWEQQGRPAGAEVQNWLLAETQLKNEAQAFSA